MNFDGFHSKVLIAESSSTIIYRVVKVPDSQSFILKYQKPSPSIRQKSERVHYEYNILTKLDHPNIIKSHDLINLEGSLALLLEDCQGISLKKFLGGRALALADFFPIAYQILSGMIEIHHKGIIHKDINPYNLIINEQKLLKIIDFDIASMTAYEQLDFQSLDQLVGTLAYIAPEQTGRMNRPIDHRSDFYSLGMTFYELLAGEQPFDFDDPQKILYHHLACDPYHLCEKNPTIPRALGDIIHKLIQKDADQRYQNAHSILADLEKVAELSSEPLPDWSSFAIAEGDISQGFHRLTKQYGRDQEIQQLKGYFDRSIQGERIVSNIEGESGIGKTFLVRELFTQMTLVSGIYLETKFEKLRPDTPYFSLKGVMNELVRQVTKLDQARIDKVAKAIDVIIGDQFAYLIEIFPALKNLCLPTIRYEGTNTQNPTQIVRKAFVELFGTLANPQHPIVLFFDDLQWVDDLTFFLIKALIEENNLTYLFIVTSYRDNDIDSSSAVLSFFSEHKEKGTIHNIKLKGLSQDTIIPHSAV